MGMKVYYSFSSYIFGLCIATIYASKRYFHLEDTTLLLLLGNMVALCVLMVLLVKHTKNNWEVLRILLMPSLLALTLVVMHYG